jgi:integrase
MTPLQQPPRRLKLTDRALSALKPRAAVYEVRDAELPQLFVRVHPSGKRTFYLDLTRRDRRALGPYGKLTVEQARELAQTLLAEAQMARVSPAHRAAQQERNAPTLRDFITDDYAPWVRAHRKDAEGTLLRLRLRFEKLLYDLRLNAITPREVERWRSARLADVGAATVNRDTTALRAVLSKAVEWRVLAAHPMREVKQLKLDNDEEPRWLTPEERAALRRALCELAVSGRNMDALAMTLLIWNTGLRRGEALSLAPDAVDWKERELTVRGSLSKTGKTRTIPLNDEAAAALALLPLPSPHPEATMWTALKRTMRRAGLTCGVHALRHDFARRLIDAGVPLPDVQRLLGHASIVMTQRYVTAGKATLRAAVDALQ